MSQAVRSGLLLVVLGAASALVGCSHVQTADHYRSKAQVLEFEGCTPMHTLKALEMELYSVGFWRHPLRQVPIPYELLENYLGQSPRIVTFTKTDYENIETRGSDPYREIPNVYGVTSCEEPGGNLFLVVVRHDPPPGDKFIGARFAEALSRTGCKWKPVAPERDLAFYVSTTEEDLIRYVRRGRCRDYGLGR